MFTFPQVRLHWPQSIFRPQMWHVHESRLRNLSWTAKRSGSRPIRGVTLASSVHVQTSADWMSLNLMYGVELVPTFPQSLAGVEDESTVDADPVSEREPAKAPRTPTTPRRTLIERSMRQSLVTCPKFSSTSQSRRQRTTRTC